MIKRPKRWGETMRAIRGPRTNSSKSVQNTTKLSPSFGSKLDRFEVFVGVVPGGAVHVHSLHLGGRRDTRERKATGLHTDPKCWLVSKISERAKRRQSWPSSPAKMQALFDMQQRQCWSSSLASSIAQKFQTVSLIRNAGWRRRFPPR